MYLQNDERDVLEVLERKLFFAAQPCWKNFYRIVLNFFSVDFTIQWWWYFCETGEKRVESFKFQFLPLSGILQEEIGKCKKSNML